LFQNFITRIITAQLLAGVAIPAPPENPKESDQPLELNALVICF
jgi:hypothetical protein